MKYREVCKALVERRAIEKGENSNDGRNVGLGKPVHEKLCAIEVGLSTS